MLAYLRKRLKVLPSNKESRNANTVHIVNLVIDITNETEKVGNQAKTLAENIQETVDKKPRLRSTKPWEAIN